MPLIKDSQPTASFVGGMRRGTFNATIPLVRLELFDEEMRLSAGSRFFDG
jgi:hypothetical protein